MQVKYILKIYDTFYECISHDDIVRIMHIFVVNGHVYYHSKQDSVRYDKKKFSEKQIIKNFINTRINKLSKHIKLYKVNLV